VCAEVQGVSEHERRAIVMSDVWLNALRDTKVMFAYLSDSSPGIPIAPARVTASSYPQCTSGKHRAFSVYVYIEWKATSLSQMEN
jgi:hypothetical protein